MAAIDIEPCNVLGLQRLFRQSNLAILKEPPAMKIRVVKPQVNQLSREIEKALLRFVQIPIEPAKLVVLAIAVVVSPLRASHLVPASKDRNSL